VNEYEGVSVSYTAEIFPEVLTYHFRQKSAYAKSINTVLW